MSKNKDKIVRTLAKIIVLLFVLLIPLAVLAPWLTGLYVKHHYVKLVENINHQAGNNDLQIVEYQTGWLSSTVKLHIQASKGLYLIVVEKISHGPILRNAKGNLIVAAAEMQSSYSLNDRFINALLAGVTNDAILKTNMTAHYNGDVYGTINMPMFDYKTPNGVGHLNWQGLNGTFYFNINNNYFSHKKTDITIGGFNAEFQNPETAQSQRYTTQPILIKVDTNITPLGLWVGTSSISTTGLADYRNNEVTNSLANLLVDANVSVQDDKFYDMTYRFKSGAIHLNKFSFLNISSLGFVLTLNNFDAVALMEVGKQYRTILTKGAPLNGGDKEQMLMLLAKTITSTSKIQNDFTGITTLGALQTNLMITWPAGAQGLTTVAELAKVTKGALKFKIAVPLATELANQYFAQYVPAAAAPVPTASSQPTTPDQQFDDLIGQLVQDGQLTTNVALQVMQMQSDSSTMDEFITKLNTLGLDAQTATVVIEKARVVEAAKLQAASMPPQPVAQPGVTAGGAVLDQWLKQGYLIQDKNDYVSEITLENGEVKINGKSISPPTPPAVLAPTAHDMVYPLRQLQAQ